MNNQDTFTKEFIRKYFTKDLMINVGEKTAAVLGNLLSDSLDRNTDKLIMEINKIVKWSGIFIVCGFIVYKAGCKLGCKIYDRLLFKSITLKNVNDDYFHLTITNTKAICIDISTPIDNIEWSEPIDIIGKNCICTTNRYFIKTKGYWYEYHTEKTEYVNKWI